MQKATDLLEIWMAGWQQKYCWTVAIQGDGKRLTAQTILETLSGQTIDRVTQNLRGKKSSIEGMEVEVTNVIPVPRTFEQALLVYCDVEYKDPGSFINNTLVYHWLCGIVSTSLRNSDLKTKLLGNRDYPYLQVEEISLVVNFIRTTR